MTAEATMLQTRGQFLKTAAAAIAAGEVHQLSNGQAAVYQGLNAAVSGQRVVFATEGQFTLPKTASIVLLDGGRAYWDHSANTVTFEKVNDRDFYLGRVVGDTAAASATVVVELNVDPPYDIDVMRDAVLSVPVGTQVVGAFGHAKYLGGALSIELTATNEAQKIDLLSVDGFATGANAIIEAIFRIPDDGGSGAQDFNIGVANGTHATDADAITESIFCHVDGNVLDLLLESDDGTVEVAATDSTINYAEGSAVANRVEVWIDMRLPADVQIYINGVLMLTATVFNVNVAAGPWFLLAHLEKTIGTDVYRVVVDALRARIMEQ